MKQYEMENLKAYSVSDNKVSVMDFEQSKFTIKQIEKKEFREKVDSLKNEYKLNLQGKGFLKLALISAKIKLKLIFSKKVTENSNQDKEFISKIWKDRKITKENYNLKNFSEQKKVFKEEYQKKLNLNIKEFTRKKNHISKNSLLVSRDGVVHENKFLNISTKSIEETKQKISELKATSTSQKQTLNKIDKLNLKLNAAKLNSKLSYEKEFKYRILESKIKFINRNIHLKEEKLQVKSNYKVSLKNLDIKYQKKQVRDTKKAARRELAKKLWANFAQMFKHKIKYISYKQNQTMYFNDYKSEVNKQAQEIEYFKLRQKMQSELISLKSEKRKNHLEHKSEVIDIYEKTPIIYKWWKVILTTLTTLIIPGTGSIINKQYIKGFIQILVSMFFYVLLLYTFGIGNIEGNGILGLIDLGHADNLWEMGDARYFIIEGSLSVLFLTMFVIYNVSSTIGTYKISIANKKGARVRTWTETKNYFTDIGYPIMTSIPTIIMLLVVVMIPIVTTFLLAFTNYKPNNASNFKWDGLNQFKEIFTLEWAKTMQKIVGWTMTWTVITWLSAFVIALTLATTLNNKRVKGKIIFRLIYVLPWAIPGFITILLFKIMFLPGSILSNFFGNDTFQSVPLYAKISVIMIQMWSGYCVNLVLITGILQSIPTDLYEAADIDGAKSSSKLFKITLPLIIYQMTPILVGQFMGAFNNFGIIYLYLDGGPYFTDISLQGGAGATETIASLIYKLISAGKAGIASALNIIVSGVIVAISVTILVRSKSVKGGVA